MTGDFNLPHINWKTFSYSGVESVSAEKILDIMFAYNLKQVVLEDTRITPTSRSILDLVFLSNKLNDYNVTVEDGISDHRMTCLDVPIRATGQIKSYVPVKIKDYARADDTSILDCF